MKTNSLLTLVLFIVSLISQSFAIELQKFDELGKITILDNGRHKPLETYARNLLLTIHHKTKIKIDGKKVPAIRWLAHLMVNPNTSYERKDCLHMKETGA